ncbi:MAG: SDR family NAD(P)-dependent oxidoreductase [Paracoccaceae bacterium]
MAASTKSAATFHDLAGASVFITGGGSGIGAALTDGFMAQGARVAFVQRSDASAYCDELAARHGTRPWFERCDVTDIAALQAALGRAAAANGPITVLVNNAANDRRHTLAGMTPAEFDETINVNLRHHFFAAQSVAPGMAAAGGGSIINYSSISYMMGNSGYPVYAASKSAITGLTRSLARELGPQNIRVNALMPGWVLTQKQRDMWVTPEGLASHMSRQALQRELDEADMVGPTLFLASAASAAMTGQALVVDGGVVVTG